MRRQSRITCLVLVAYCSLSGLSVLADDPFSSGDPFSPRTVAEPEMGVTRLTIAKSTPRAQTLAASPYQHIEATLSSKTAIRVKEMPLSQVMRKISETHHIPIFPQRRALQAAKVSLETPVTIDVRSVSLRAGLNLVLSKAGLDYIVKDEVIQYTTLDAALRQPVEMRYQLRDQDESSIEMLVKSVQKLLEKEHKAPMPPPVVTASKETELNKGRRTLVVTCNYRMHAIVRDHLSKGASADPEAVPR